MTDVTLTKIADFQNVLADYSPSKATLNTLASMPLGIMVGITGAGKNTIMNQLMNIGGYYIIVSDTTRPPKVRDGRMEVDGLQYNFVSEDAFLDGLRSGDYIEAEIIHRQQVSGANSHELEKAAKSGKIPINEIEIKGAKRIAEYKPDTKFFFIVPPSYKEWMSRLLGREVMTEEEKAKRISTAIDELEVGLRHDEFIFVINDSSEKSASMINEIMHGRRFDDHHDEAVAAAKEILADIKQHHSNR